MYKNIFIYIKILFITFFALYTLFLFGAGWITDNKRGKGVSTSIKESKINNSFVAEYTVENIPNSTKKILEELKLLSILDTLEIWVEKEYGYETFLLYSNKIKYSDENYLVFKNPTEILEKSDPTISMKMIEGTYPKLGIYINIDSTHSTTNILKMNDIPNTLNIGISLYNMRFNNEERLPEKIKLRLKYKNPNNVFTDTRSLWDKINMFSK